MSVERKMRAFGLLGGTAACLAVACGLDFAASEERARDSGGGDTTALDGTPIFPGEDVQVVPDATTDVADVVTKVPSRFCETLSLKEGFCEDFDTPLAAPWEPLPLLPGLSIATAVDAGVQGDLFSLQAAVDAPSRIEIRRRALFPTGIKALELRGRITPLAVDSNPPSLTFAGVGLYTVAPPDAGPATDSDLRLSLQIYRTSGDVHIGAYYRTKTPPTEGIIFTNAAIIPVGGTARYRLHVEANSLVLYVEVGGVVSMSPLAILADPAALRLGDVSVGAISVRSQVNDFGVIASPSGSDWAVQIDDFVVDSTPP